MSFVEPVAYTQPTEEWASLLGPESSTHVNVLPARRSPTDVARQFGVTHDELRRFILAVGADNRWLDHRLALALGGESAIEDSLLNETPGLRGDYKQIAAGIFDLHFGHAEVFAIYLRHNCAGLSDGDLDFLSERVTRLIRAGDPPEAMPPQRRRPIDEIRNYVRSAAGCDDDEGKAWMGLSPRAMHRLESHAAGLHIRFRAGLLTDPETCLEVIDQLSQDDKVVFTDDLRQLRQAIEQAFLAGDEGGWLSAWQDASWKSRQAIERRAPWAIVTGIEHGLGSGVFERSAILYVASEVANADERRPTKHFRNRAAAQVRADYLALTCRVKPNWSKALEDGGPYGLFLRSIDAALGSDLAPAVRNVVR